jgi:hypothetical protein
MRYVLPTRIARTGKQSWRGSTRALYKVLIQYRDECHVNDIDRLLETCSNPDEAVRQWARANIPNIAIGHQIREILGPDDPDIIQRRARLQRKTRRNYNHLKWP